MGRGKNIKLSDFEGKKNLLSFHPLAWTKVCADQMMSLEKNRERLEKLRTVALGISVDTIPSKKAWAQQLGIENTRLLSDFWPHGKVAQLYGIFRDKVGLSERDDVFAAVSGLKKDIVEK
jgi:peroxiredoxin